MKMIQKLKTAGLAMLLAVAGMSPALAQQPIFETVTEQSPAIIVYATATSSAACTLGRHGCLLTQTFNAVAGATYSSFSQLPYKARVLLDYFDSGSNGTLVCTNVLLRGIDAQGMQTTDETLTNVGETGATSARAYTAITRMVISGCSGGAASDLIQLRVAPRELAPGVILASSAGILGACFKASNSPWYCGTAAGAASAGGGTTITFNASILDGYQVSVIAQGRKFFRKL